MPTAKPRVAPWESPPLADQEEPAAPERGEGAILHCGETRGRRSKQFPDLNITATAAQLGITKSHLAKVLSGDNRPSLELAGQLAEVLGVSLEYIRKLSKGKK